MMFRWDRPPRVVGHRGNPSEAPENTLASFAAAKACGAPAIELDVRVTRDGQLVVHHDAQLGRVFGGEGLVEELTLAQLRGMACHAKPGERIPTLTEVLSSFDGLVDVEIKADAENAAMAPDKVLRAVKDADALDRVLVTSFDAEIADAYAAVSGRPAGLIYPFPPDEEDLAAWPRLGFVALAADACEAMVIESMRRANRRVLAWTVNDVEMARSLLKEGVDTIITDKPAAMAGL